MFRTGLAALATFLFATNALAEWRDPVDVFVSGRLSIGASPLLAVGEPMNLADQQEIDYAVFAHELVAYIAKEVLPDAGDEFAGSEIPSRLSVSMPSSQSRFGAHCLVVLRQVGSHMSPATNAMPSLSSLSVASYVVRAGSAVLALTNLVNDLRHDDRDGAKTDSRFSLNPKVGTNKIGAYVTIRW